MEMSYIVNPKLIGRDPLTGDPVELTAVQDNDGNWVLRTVDSAPFAYNVIADAKRGLNVNVSGAEIFTLATPGIVRTSRKREIVKIADNISILPGASSANIIMNCDGTESEVWLAISINKFPWTLKGNNGFDGIWSTAFYPERTSVGVVYPMTTPASSLALGVLPAASGLPVPTTLTEAKALAMPLNPTSFFNITNGHATDTATVTAWCTKVWR